MAWIDVDGHQRFRDRAEGLITDMPQSEYERTLIDRSAPMEAKQATGKPVAHDVKFRAEGD